MGKKHDKALGDESIAGDEIDVDAENRKREAPERKWPCSYCDYVAPTASLLTKHEMTHTGKKAFSCRVCEYSCNPTKTMIDHELIHGMKPYECKLCYYQAREISHLRKHVARQHRRPWKPSDELTAENETV